MDVQPTPTLHPPAGIHWYTLVINFTMYRTLQNVLKKEQQTPHGRATPPPDVDPLAPHANSIAIGCSFIQCFSTKQCY